VIENSKNIRLTNSQHDVLAWIEYVVNSYSCFEEKDIDRLIQLKLVKFKKRPLALFSVTSPVTGKVTGKELQYDGDCTLTREGKKYLRPSSIFSALIELSLTNGPLDSYHLERISIGNNKS